MLAVTIGGAADVQEIVGRGAEVLRSDFAAFPSYAYIERDETRQGNKVSSRTSQVLTIEGSDYYMPVAIDDKPLPAEQRAAELSKLHTEVERRKSETAEAREKRLTAFRKQQSENATLILEFPKSFTFALTGEEEKNGHPAYVLSATPKKREAPLSRAAKVLSGMKGVMWVDRAGFHTIRAECSVISPVSMFGIFARVLPGTHVEVELSPVSNSVWLISRYTVTLTISKFWFKSTQVTDSSYSDFQPNDAVLQALLGQSRAGQ